jgi:hypothetical protein
MSARFVERRRHCFSCRTPVLRRCHRDDLTEWHWSRIRGGPNYGVVRRVVRKHAPQVGQKHHCLWVNPLLFQPAEARTEIRATAADRGGLAGPPDTFSWRCTSASKVENIHQPRLLTGQDGTYFNFEETEPAGRGSSQSSRRQW